jgi:hypothetical protein
MKASVMQTAELAETCEKILAENVAEVASELRLVNVVDLIDYVRGERSTTLDDLVNSSAELYFKPGAVRYAWSAELDVLWEALPSVSLNMEFRWNGATAFFCLRLGATRGAIALQHVAFDEGACREDSAVRFARAMADARRQPRRRQGESVMVWTPSP